MWLLTSLPDGKASYPQGVGMEIFYITSTTPKIINFDISKINLLYCLSYDQNSGRTQLLRKKAVWHLVLWPRACVLKVSKYLSTYACKICEIKLYLCLRNLFSASPLSDQSGHLPQSARSASPALSAQPATHTNRKFKDITVPQWMSDQWIRLWLHHRHTNLFFFFTFNAN